MRSKSQPPMVQGSSDDFQTPPEALESLLPYLKKDWVIWECAEGNGNLSEALFRKGFSVIGSDILINDVPGITSYDKVRQVPYTRMWGKNFLYWEPEHFDCIITNPPFSLKQEFLERCYKLKKPFALLLPLTTFETYKRQKLFRKFGLQVIFFDKRINFQTESGSGSGSWFASAWFTSGLNLPKELNFVKLRGGIDQTELE